MKSWTQHDFVLRGPASRDHAWLECRNCGCFVAFYLEPAWEHTVRERKRWFHPDGLRETYEKHAMEPPCYDHAEAAEEAEEIRRRLGWNHELTTDHTIEKKEER